MSVKRFTASNMSRALELVRQEMGPDAIILSTKRVDGNVEIVTSLDKDLPTRHAEQHRNFQRNFDPDIDLPLESDEAWKLQDGAQKAIDQHRFSAPNMNGSNQLNFSSQAEVSAKRLAKEIEKARDKMLAAQSHSQSQTQSQSKLNMTKSEERVAPVVGDFGKGNIDKSWLGSEPELRAIKTEGQLGHLQDRINSANFSRDKSSDLFSDEQFDLFAQDKNIESNKTANANDERLNELQNELTQVRALLEKQLKQRDLRNEQFIAGQNHYTAGSVEQNLRDMGLSNSNVIKLCRDLPQEQTINLRWKQVMNRLAKQIPIDSSDKIDQGGIFALVGATGVGKTTTIAKLAARYVMNHGANSVAIVTTDTFRIGALDQLRSLGRILNVPVKVADNKNKLQQTLDQLCCYSLVLIDTAGFRYGDPLLKAQNDMLASCADVQRILVLASNSQSQCLKASMHAYGGNDLLGCVLSKIDESPSLGESISLLCENKVMLMYTTQGQEIPNDLDLSNSQKLVIEAVRRLKQQKADEKSYVQGA